MAQRSIKGNQKLAQAIRLRRSELDLTIEEAAQKAGVGTKTWSRYESGASIRVDKYPAVCKALGWRTLPEIDSNDDTTIRIEDYKTHEAWSPYIAENYGVLAAFSFAVGSDILLDHISEDLEGLSSLPRGSHIGQLSFSWIASELPPQFLMRYDYEFLYAFRSTVIRLRKGAKIRRNLRANSVMEKLAFYLSVDASCIFEYDVLREDTYNDWDEWVFDMFDDGDLITFLYSDRFSNEGEMYHFDRWRESQFWLQE